MRGGLASGRGGDVGDPLSEMRGEDADTAWLAWSWGVARPSRTAGSAAGSPMPRTMSESGTSAPRSTLTPARSQLGLEPVRRWPRADSGAG